MIKLVTVDEMRTIEAAADSSGISYDTMMERAGRAAADRAAAILADIPQPRITILTGPGNNGGDGLVAGLFIAQDNAEADVRFYLLKERAEDDPHMAVVREAGLFVATAENDHDYRVLKNMVASADLVLDALFGIGLRLPLRDEAARILRMANQAINARRRERPESLIIDPSQPAQIPRPPRLYVLAIDCPSGVDCDSGEVDQTTIPADETITFIAAKYGLVTYPAAAICGNLSVADLGIPESLKELKQITTRLIDAESIRSSLPDRASDSHKGTHGRALIIGGSLNYVGAPALAASAAYRTGAGLVTVATPRPVMASLAAHLHEPTWILLPHDMGIISENAVSVLADENLDSFRALLIGPGMGHDTASEDFLKTLLTESTTAHRTARRQIGFNITAADSPESDPTDSAENTLTLPALVLDADALNILATLEDWQEHLPENTILTPHPGEMARLTGMTTKVIQADRLSIARRYAGEWQTIILLKGAHTVIAAPDGKTAVLPFKNDALATAGTGDILAGIIVALLAQGMKPFDAALAGGYLHGLAGEFAIQHRSSRSLMAGDLVTYLGEALLALEA